MSNEHRIDRISVSSRAADLITAREQQSTLSRLVRGPVARAWNRVMDRYAGAEETIRIDLLELRLADWSAELSEREIERRLTEALDQQLRKQLSPLTTDRRVATQSTAHYLADRWTEFLLTGRWYTPEGTTTPQSFFAAAVAEEASTLVPAWRAAYHRGGRLAIDRLVQQLPLQALGTWLARQWEENTPAKAFQVAYWRGRGWSGSVAKELCRAWLRTVALAVADPTQQRDWIRLFWSFVLAQWPAALPLPDLERRRGWPLAWKKVARRYAGRTVEELLRERGPNQDNNPANAPDLATEKNERQEAATRFVTGAGIVLLHPYLATFFAELQLLDTAAKDFRDTEAREQALQLCHWLVTGAVTCGEQQTTLYQLLCSWPDEAVPTTDHVLPTEWLTAGNRLLEAVVRNWDKLGQATPDALREGFLQRAGKLGRDSLGDYLRVEQRGVDVLLEYLPWGIGVVKLPWMKNMLRVEWT